MPQLSDKAKEKAQALNKALESGTFVQVRQMLSSMPPADIAHLIESSPPRDRSILWRLIDKEDESEVLSYLSEEIRGHFLQRLDTEEIVTMVDDLDIDDFADLLQALPLTVTQEVLRSMDDQNRLRVETALAYPEDTAGGLMDTVFISIRPNISIDVVFRYLRRHSEIPDLTDTLWVVNRSDQFVGALSITKLLVTDPSVTVREAMDTNAEVIHVNTPAKDVANLFERHDLVSAPVVDDNNRILGRITIDDVVDVIREEADHNILSAAGLDDDEDTFAPVFKTSKRRAVWLGINLLTAILASMVIGIFDATISQVVALAILMPIVASMGGIAGNQTLTLVIRGMALGHIGTSNTKWLMSREFGVGLINGILWAVVIGSIAALWFQETTIGLVIASAMLINQIIATLTGAILPMILKRLNIDPVLAGGVILTTITDVAGFFLFLGLATAVYM